MPFTLTLIIHIPVSQSLLCQIFLSAIYQFSPWPFSLPSSASLRLQHFPAHISMFLLITVSSASFVTPTKYRHNKFELTQILIIKFGCAEQTEWWSNRTGDVATITRRKENGSEWLSMCWWCELVLRRNKNNSEEKEEQQKLLYTLAKTSTGEATTAAGTIEG